MEMQALGIFCNYYNLQQLDMDMRKSSGIHSRLGLIQESANHTS
jgi:hypothetical protein